MEGTDRRIFEVPELLPLEKKALPAGDECFNTPLNPVVEAAENAKYALLDLHEGWTKQDEIDAALMDIRRVEALPPQLIPEKAREEMALAKRLIKGAGGTVKFSRREKSYLRKKFDSDPPDFYE